MRSSTHAEFLTAFAPDNAPAAPAAPPAAGKHLQAARALMVLGATVFALSLAGALADREPFDTWFYSLAWWSAIVSMDGWVYRRRGESLLLSHPARFLFFAVYSIGLWFLFEVLNIRLGNWSYQGLPADRAVRWAGYILGFATVVPALMETADLLDTAAVLQNGRIKPLGWKKPVEKYFVLSGAAMLVLALAWPRIFFPFVWIVFALLLDPLNERLGAPSLIADWREGSTRRLSVLLLSGLLCGVLWEAWNMPARARWVYHLPGLDHIKMFEMPLPGYLGFPLFAVEAFVMSSLAVTLWERSPKPLRILLLAAWAAFAYVSCGWVDLFTAGVPS